MSGFAPYFHPTTVVLIDDQARYLDTLSFGLTSLDVNFKCFGSAREALAWINAIEPPSSFPLDEDIEEGAIPSFRERMLDAHRFSQVAVVIVDYDMPEMSGLEFCDALDSTQIRKIMLTGVAGENIALEAFNNDRIDRFIVKQDEEVMGKLIKSVRKLLRVSFSNQSSYLYQNKTIHHYLPFMEEAAFMKLFEKIFSEGNYVEYYGSAAPSGVYLVKSNGDIDFLVVQGEDLCADQLVIARDQQAPDELLVAIAKDDVVSFFQQTGYYSAGCKQWQSSLHQASNFKGEKQGYRYALVKRPVLDDGGNKALSFESFLEQGA